MRTYGRHQRHLAAEKNITVSAATRDTKTLLLLHSGPRVVFSQYKVVLKDQITSDHLT